MASSDSSEHLNPIHAGHTDVQQDAAGSELFEFLDRRAAICGSFDKVSVRFQAVLKDLPDVRIVIHYQDVLWHHSARLIASSSTNIRVLIAHFAKAVHVEHRDLPIRSTLFVSKKIRFENKMIHPISEASSSWSELSD
jgi:hypothetical protein